MRTRRRRARSWSLAASLLVLALGIAACGRDSDSGNPSSRLTLKEAKAPIEGAPKELAAIRAQANTLLDGGVDAFDARLESLRGFPVVVNVWASWCGPCRHEFPFFQAQATKYADRIAFLGVDVADSDAAAKTFLGELPLPYPSYTDPGSGVSDAAIAKSLDVGPGVPNTIFFDRDGEVAYHWRGSYAEEKDLAEQIERYAR